MIVLPDAYQLLHLTEIDSTNTQAKRLADMGERQAHWIIADEQTAGRGRRGRAWQSPKGNLMTTLYLPRTALEHAGQAISAEKAAALAFVCGLAVAQVLQDLTEGTAHVVSIKWPNDVLVNGAKISGMLLETSNQGHEQINWLAIGIGINIAAHPDDTPYPATSLAQLIGKTLSSLEVLEMLAYAFDKFFKQWQQQGVGVILQQWRKLAHHIGKNIEVHLAHSTLAGVFEGIDDRGTLILCDDSGTRHHITTGDVFFNRKN